ncbi:odorant receptor 131-2-like [Anguilla rostrata]|uniref:odorant receptor 131-2-like n=1 Tax=Anguilla rostrata TaxID=7938 RepID=UPI0030D4F74D
MAENSTAQNGSLSSGATLSQMSEKLLILHVLVGIFLYVNCLMIFTFFKKEAFRNDVRYILFVHTLFCDSLFLVLTNVQLVLSRTNVPILVGLCLCLNMVMSLLTFSTPLTLMAMSLERYVAICMPLRHAEISTASKAVRCIPVIHALSSIQLIIFTSILISIVPSSFYMEKRLCNVEIFTVHKWQGYIRSAILQLYFVVMSSVIVFTYVKIMRAAKLASTDKKKSASKGLRTVALHAIQLMLCLIQLWCPFIEMVILEIDLQLFMNVRYFNYIVFILVPRCLSPLVYGLRDDKFFLVLKYYALCGMCKKISPVIILSKKRTNIVFIKT